MQIAGALGDAAYAVGKYPEAIVLLSRILREATDLPAEDRAAKEKRVAEGKARCGTLVIDAPAGVAVRVDGALAGTLPLREVLYVLPGDHVVELVLPSGVQKETVSVKAGGSVRVAARPLEAGAGAKGSPSPGTPAAPAAPAATGGRGAALPGKGPVRRPESSAPEASAAPVVLLSALAGAGVVVGGVLLGVSVAKEREANSRDKYGARTRAECEQRNVVTECQQTDRLLGERDALGSAALGVWIGAGIVGAAAATVAIVQKRRRPAVAVTGVPVVSPTGAGFVLRGSF